MISPILLWETKGQYVSFNLDTSVQQHFVLYSETFTIDWNNPTHIELIRLIDEFEPLANRDEFTVKVRKGSDKFISVIFVDRVVDSKDYNLPINIRGLLSIDPDSPPYPDPLPIPDPNPIVGHCIVITVSARNFLQILHKPKRTQGKVSNKLG
jgi:hypothetical protein